MLAEGMHRAHRAAPQRHEHPGFGAGKTVAMAKHLLDPAGNLEAECDGQGVTVVGAGDGQCFGMGFGKAGEFVQHLAKTFHECRVCAPHQQRAAGLHQVLGGGAPVHMTAGLGRARGAQRAGQ
jgi:hypothetical protein